MGTQEEKLNHENLRNQGRLAYSLSMEKGLSELSSLRRSSRLRGGAQVSYRDSRPWSVRAKREIGDSSSPLGGDSRDIKRKLVAKESKKSVIAPHVKKDDIKKRFSPVALAPQCGEEGRGSAYDPLFGICCYFCRQKKLCGEKQCRRCGGLDMDQPCKEMEEVRKKKIKWICQNCSAEKGITSYSIYDSSLNDLLYPKKGMVDPTRMTVLRDDGDVELMAHVPQTAPKEGSAHGGEGPTHEKESTTLRPKIEETFFDPGQPVGITTELDMGVGRDEMDFFGATGRITSLASPVPRTSSSLPETAAVGQTTKQPKHDHDKITNRLKALEQSVVQGVEEMKQLVHSSCTTLKQEMKSLFIKALEDFQSRSINNLIQNYGLIDVHVGRLVQLITTHGSDLKREVSQMKMSLTQENIGLSEQLATTPTRDALNSTGVTIDGKSQ